MQGLGLFMVNCWLVQLLRRLLSFDFLVWIVIRRTFVNQPKLSGLDLLLFVVGLFTVSPFGVDRLISFC